MTNITSIMKKMIAPTVLLFSIIIMILTSETNAFAPTTISSPSPIINKKYNQNIQNNSIDFMKRRSLHVMYDAINDGDNKEEKEEDAKKRVQQEIFWAKQRAMAAEFAAKEDAGLKSEQKEKFAQRRMALVSDTAYFSVLIACLLWIVSANPFVTISYLFGTMSGTAYAYGLGKYVETIGGSIDDAEIEGAGIGQARFAFLILLFVVVGRFRDQGLLEIPSIMGFFTYQLASLGQGLREIDD